MSIATMGRFQCSQAAVDAIARDLSGMLEREWARANTVPVGIGLERVALMVRRALEAEAEQSEARTGFPPSSVWWVVPLRLDDRLVSIRYVVDSDGLAWKSSSEDCRFEPLPEEP